MKERTINILSFISRLHKEGCSISITDKPDHTKPLFSYTQDDIDHINFDLINSDGVIPDNPWPRGDISDEPFSARDLEPSECELKDKKDAEIKTQMAKDIFISIDFTRLGGNDAFKSHFEVSCNIAERIFDRFNK